MDYIPSSSGGGGVTAAEMQSSLNEAYASKPAFRFDGSGANGMVGYSAATDQYNSGGEENPLWDQLRGPTNGQRTKGALEAIIRPQLLSATNQSIYGGMQAINGASDFLCFGHTDSGKLYADLWNSGSQSWGIITDSAVLEVDNVYHIMLLHDGTRPYLYLNGVVQTVTDTVSTNLTHWAANVSTGEQMVCGGTFDFFGAGWQDNFVGEIYRLRPWNDDPSEAVRLASILGDVPSQWAGAVSDNHLAGDALASWAPTGEFADMGGDMVYTWAAGGVSTAVQNVVGGAAPRIINGKPYKMYRLRYVISGLTMGTMSIDNWQITNSFANTAVDLPTIANGTHEVEFLSSADCDVNDFVLTLTTSGGSGGETFTIAMAPFGANTICLQQIGCIAEFNEHGIEGALWRDTLNPYSSRPVTSGTDWYAIDAVMGPGITGAAYVPTGGVPVRVPTGDKICISVRKVDSDFTTGNIVPKGYKVDAVVIETILNASGQVDIDVSIGATNIVNAEAIGVGLDADATLVTTLPAYATDFEEVVIADDTTGWLGGTFDIHILMSRFN